MVVRARTELGPRLLVVAGACLLPAAAYAASQSLDPRNYAGLAVLSAVALGVGGAMAVRVLLARTGSRRLARASLVALVMLSVGGGIAAGQRSVGPAPPPGTADALAAWLRANTTEGDRIAMTFRDRESMALRLFGVVEVANLPLVRVNPKDDPGAFLWMGLRDRQLFGYRRAAWTRVLTSPAARYLALSGPHPFHPTELVRAIVAGRIPGLDRVAWFDEGTDHADVFVVDAAALALTPGAVSTSLSSDAALAWLDLAGPVLGKDVAATRLLSARPEVTGSSLPALQARLGTCAVSSAPDGPVTLGTADACGG